MDTRESVLHVEGVLDTRESVLHEESGKTRRGARDDLEANAIGAPVVGRIRRNSVLHTVRVRFDGNTVREYRLDSNTVGGHAAREHPGVRPHGGRRVRRLPAAATLAATGFDPFGARREADWSSDATAATWANALAVQAERSGRGFGNHEGLHRTGFVHMNGRVYDPRLGRFLQPDPVVTFPHTSQGHNRYAYVLNRPLSLADPTGLSPVDINAVILGELWDHVSSADVPVYHLSGVDSIVARGLDNRGLNTYLRTKIHIEECLSGGCARLITFVGRASSSR